MFPDRFLAQGGPMAIEEPTVADGQRRVDGGTIGSFDLMLVMGARLGYDRAWAAVQAWGGDAYAVSDRAGTTCVQITARGTDRAATDVLARAFADWAATVPGAEASQDADGAHLGNCDEAAIPAAQLPEQTSTLDLAEVRAGMVGALLRKDGATRSGVECAVEGMRSLLGNDGFVRAVTVDTDTGIDALVQAERSCATYFPEFVGAQRVDGAPEPG
jgi:hypothetical protein